MVQHLNDAELPISKHLIVRSSVTSKHSVEIIAPFPIRNMGCIKGKGLTILYHLHLTDLAMFLLFMIASNKLAATSFFTL